MILHAVQKVITTSGDADCEGRARHFYTNSYADVQDLEFPKAVESREDFTAFGNSNNFQLQIGSSQNFQLNINLYRFIQSVHPQSPHTG